MFSFLNPFMLLGLIASAIPLIIHFLTKHKPKQVFFSTIRFLKELEESKRRRVRIDFLLLLLLRILIILFFCFALARPLISYNRFFNFGSKIPRSIVLVIDNSYSMGSLNNGETLFNLARKKAIEITENISFEDEVNIIFFNEKANIELSEFTNNKQVLKDVLNSKKISFLKTKGQTGLDLAEEILKRKDVNSDRIIYLFSDFQKNGFIGLKPKIRGVKIIPIPVKLKEISNCTITGIKFPSDFISARNTARIIINVKNIGEEKKVRIGLYVEKNKVGETGIVLKKDAEGEGVFFYTFPKRGIYTGFGEIVGQDVLAADDRFYFSVEVKDSLNTLLITDKEGQENYYVKQVFFSSSSNPSPIVLKLISPLGLQSDRLKSFSVVIIDNLSDIDENLNKMLFEFTNSGGGVFLSLGKNISQEKYNKIFFAGEKDGYILPAKIKFKVGSEEEVNKFFTIASFDPAHPIFKIFTPQSFLSTHFYSFYNTEPDPLDSNTRVIAKFDDGLPWIIERKIGSGKVILFTSSLDTDWSDFPLRPNYLPLLHQIVYYLAKPEQLEERMYCLGEEFSQDKPGIVLRSKPDDYIAFNLNRVESDIASFTKRETENIFESDKTFGKKTAIGSEREVTTMFLLITLLFLIAENIIANKEKIRLE